MDKMNHSYNSKKRPLHEDDPAVSVSQHSFVSSTPAFPVVGPSQDQKLQIVKQAASVLGCPIEEILALDRTASFSVSSYPAPKRMRFDSDIPHMSNQEKPPPSSGLSDQERQEHSQRGRSLDHVPFSEPGSSGLSNCLGSAWSVCTSWANCDQSSQGYTGIPTSQYEQATWSPQQNIKSSSSPQSQSWTMHQPRGDVFPYDSSSAVTSQILSTIYPPLSLGQPMAVQPPNRNERMIYPETPSTNIYAGSYSTNNHGIDSQGALHVHVEGSGTDGPRYSSTPNLLSPDGLAQQLPAQPHCLDIVQSHQRAPATKRGPFKSTAEREQTAETRRIGSCVRCRMQRIRCEMNPDDKLGTCITCSKVTNAKVGRLPCLRYKITDVKLYKPGPVKGFERTRRWTWAEGITDDISQWASSQTISVCVTEGYTRPVLLRVRQFVPQEGDALERTWMHRGVKKTVKIPPFAIVDIDETRLTYQQHIQQRVKESCHSVLAQREKLIQYTYGLAIKQAEASTTPAKEKELIRKVLQLWVAVRMTTKSTVIVGDETLGMPKDILDETSPIKGQVPLPPVMGAQIELVLIHHIQVKLRKEMLEALQVMTQANSHSTWLTTYLITFILLHNTSLLCQHDAGYARKHGIKGRYARVENVREYQLGANILLAYFHYCNKGVYPFSMECKDQELTTLAKLEPKHIDYVKSTRKYIQKEKKQWEKVRESNDYENDFFFASQLFEENWQPRTTI